MARPHVFHAAAVAVLFSLHHIVALVAAQGDYTPFSAADDVSPQVWDETARYAPSARRFLEDAALGADDVGGSRFDNVQPIVPSIVVGGLARALGGLEVTWIVLHALLPAATWLLAFVIAGWYTRDRALRIVVAWAAVLVPFGIRSAFLLDGVAFRQPLELERLHHPGLSFPLFLVALIAARRALATGEAARIGLAAVATGALVYVYYFYWVAATGAALLLVVASALMRDRAGARRSLALSAGSLAVALPFLVLTASRRDEQHALLERVGHFTHEPVSRHVLLLVLLGAALVAYVLIARRSSQSVSRDPTALLLAALVAGAVGLNLQVLTGYDAEHDHFLLRVIKPLGFLLAAAALAPVIARALRDRKAVLAVGAVVVVALGGLAAARQTTVALRTLDEHRTSEPVYELAEWTRDHVPASSVIATTDGRLGETLAAVAGTRLFVPDGGRTSLSDEEILRRYVAAAKLEGRTLAESERDLRGEGLATGAPEWASAAWRLFIYSAEGRALLPALPSLWEQTRPEQAVLTRPLDFVVVRGERIPAALAAVFPTARPVRTAGPWTLVAVRRRG